MEHVPKRCDVKGCKLDASYWIDTSEGFLEALLPEGTNDTFYLCVDHKYELDGKDEHEGGYLHLRIDTGELRWLEIGKYCCSGKCEVCLE